MSEVQAGVWKEELIGMFGYIYVKNRGKGGFVARFVPRRKKKDRDFLRIVKETAENDNSIKHEESEKAE